MAKWTRTIKIKDALSNDTSADGIRAASSTIMSRLKGAGAPLARVEKARDIAAHDPETALLVFNEGLNKIYDWADENRVWLA